ncbi:DUF2256 domain-containing protein [Bosea sp. PAMC 26642]|uniref:DUF2256 domain-containing protein n=1 Tax=Bosea sp. (strain PAMC 26642) TaxID=1792307 RepID=UPI0009EC1C1A
MLRKGDLPAKICVVCQRPFAWRKKWKRVWETMSTCSERCRNEAQRIRRTAG